MTARERIARLRELQDAAPKPKLVSAHIVSKGYEHLANLCGELEPKQDYAGFCLGMMPKEWADLIAGAVNALPALLDIAEAAVTRSVYHGHTDERKCRCGLCAALAKLEGK